MIRWELLSSEDKNFVLTEAIHRGWADNKIQVRKIQGRNRTIWIIEPYDDCKCSGIVKIEDYLEGKI